MPWIRGPRPATPGSTGRALAIAHLARADGSYPRLLIRIARVDVLVLDDWGMAPIREAERRDMLEIVDDRYGSRATVLTSQIPPEKWHDLVGDPTTADAICDRLLHNAHRFALKGIRFTDPCSGFVGKRSWCGGGPVEVSEVSPPVGAGPSTSYRGARRGSRSDPAQQRAPCCRGARGCAPKTAERARACGGWATSARVG